MKNLRLKSRNAMMLMATLMLICLAILAKGQSNTNHNQPKETLAVISIDTKGITSDKSAIRKMVLLEVEKANIYTVMDKYDIDDILDKDVYELQECYGKNCLVKMGKLLKVDKMLTGNIEKLGDRIIITFRIIDVESALIEKVEAGEYLNLQAEIHKMIRISLNNLFEIENDENLVNLLVDYDSPIFGPQNKIKLSGPRMGIAYTTGEAGKRLQASKAEGGYEMFPIITQFGYQWETQYLSAGSFQALVEVIGLIGGLESGNIIPSISILNGFRSSKNGWEFAFGPSFKLVKTANGYYDDGDNWHLESEWDSANGENPYEIQELPDSRGIVKISTNLVLAIGKTFKSGYLNIPINVYVVPNKKGTIIGTSIGFNINKESR